MEDTMTKNKTKLNMAKLYANQLEQTEYKRQQLVMFSAKPLSTDQTRGILVLKDIKSGDMVNQFVFTNSGLYKNAVKILDSMENDGEYRQVPIVELDFRLNRTKDEKVYANISYIHNTGEFQIVKQQYRPLKQQILKKQLLQK